MKIIEGVLPIPQKHIKRDKVTRKIVKNRNDFDKVYCPKCNKLNTYRVLNENKTLTCPWCREFFIPKQTPRKGRNVGWQEWDNLTDWDEI